MTDSREDKLEKMLIDKHESLLLKCGKELNGGEYETLFSHIFAPILIRAIREAIRLTREEKWHEYPGERPDEGTFVAVDIGIGHAIPHFFGNKDLPMGKQVKRWCYLPTPPSTESETR